MPRIMPNVAEWIETTVDWKITVILTVVILVVIGGVILYNKYYK